MIPAMNEYATAAAEKLAYSDYWSQNAGSFETQGCYEWMASQLEGIQPKRVFDIGCGTGEGILAIQKRFGSEILAIDENLQCLRRAHRLFRKHGVEADLRFRFSYRQQFGGAHLIEADKAKINLSSSVKLVQADMLLPDPAFEACLMEQAPFDAITVWLIGTYQCRFTCANLIPLNIQSPQEYRLHVQNRIYALAPKILRPGGVLQVVDRGEALKTKADEDDTLNAHREQAALGDLKVGDLATRPYVEHGTKKGVSMVLSPGKSGRVPDAIETTMCSVLSVKP